ncbi:S-type pyocin domain-containing protein [Pseudomonas sp. R5(2019)]|uniref:S-type pyocin domain-containing protein n=1 Tax=Pseudomonas sp. R5(2019) TaxID=2697566 RepID=UPI001411E9F2|nr:S-type pyocin domain-containing protein [Pseudomonas sp. R5(2019)]NBA93416.1 hypothetical protein [Pseudomonas sp. R5(2019)]
MELKPNLQAYTETQFLTLLNTLWEADMSEAEHNRLVQHFDEICEHPLGADLLFYSADYGHWANPEGIVATIKASLAYRTRPGFADDPSAPAKPAQASGPLDPAFDAATQAAAERQAIRIANAASRSTRFPDLLALANQLDQAEQTAEQALSQWDNAIRDIERSLAAPQPEQTPTQRMNQLEADRATLELLGSSARKAVWNIRGIRMRVEFAQGSAESAFRFQSRGKTLEELQSALQFITQIAEQHAASWPAVEAYHVQLKTRGEALLELFDERRIRLQAASGQQPWNSPSHLSIAAKSASQGPRILTPALGAMNAFTELLIPLQQSLLSAVAYINRLTENGQSSVGLSADILRFSTRLGHDERFALSLPLTALGPLPEANWQELARQESDLQLALRLGSGPVIQDGRTFQRVFVVSADGPAMPRRIRVRSASFDSKRQLYSFTTPGAGPITLNWTLPDSVDVVPAAPSATQYPGIMSAPRQPLFEALDPATDLLIDDYIIVFPAASRLPPLYVMFKPCLDYPGVASGQGEHLQRPLLDFGGGAPIPASIADLMRGRVFKHFAAFKRALLQAIGEDPQVSAEVEGVPMGIYHKLAVEAGGGVFDMDNLVIARSH